MKLSARLLIFLIICTLSTQGVKAEDANDLYAGQNSAVAIELTKFDVNDTTLELAWKIRNDTEHDIWICKGISPAYSPIIDLFMDKDAKTLVIRRRFDLLLERQSPKPFISRYVRLRPFQEMAESVSIALPVEPDTIFNLLRANAEFAESISIEIGFYNEDLPGLILKIVDLAEKLSCDIGLNSPIWDFNDTEVSNRFFGGVYIARFFYLESFGYFRNSVTSGGDEVVIPYMRQTLNGEQILRLKIDNVSIPYECNYPPLENQNVNEPADSQDVEEEQSAVSMELTHFEITDANLELDWKIKNNTDHDVWICDSIATSRTFQFEVFLAEDFQILVIRRRLDVPSYVAWARGAPSGKYVCLRPGEERPESLSLNLPVQYSLLYGLGKWTTAEKCAGCLELEIGFYDQNLPGLVYSILQLADALLSGIDQEADYEADFAVIKEYFKGLRVRASVGSLSYFEKVNNDPYSEGEVLIGYTSQALAGEKVLRIVVDGMSIPYEGYVQLASE